MWLVANSIAGRTSNTNPDFFASASRSSAVHISGVVEPLSPRVAVWMFGGCCESAVPQRTNWLTRTRPTHLLILGPLNSAGTRALYGDTRCRVAGDLSAGPAYSTMPSRH